MIAAVLLFIGLSVVFGVLYYLNAKTPKPEGCESMREDCAGCQNVMCSHCAKKGESL